jgi:hypothetical protein
MISFESTARFRARIRDLGLSPDEVFAAMRATASAWGKPHQHSGIAIRRLNREWHESRAGLHVRLVFAIESGRLIFDFAGSHDEVRRFVRGR